MQAGFLFEAQTGLVHMTRPQAPSNFHRYALPIEALGRVEHEVEQADLGSGGYEYSAEFLAWVKAQALRQVQLVDGVWP